MGPHASRRGAGRGRAAGRELRLPSRDRRIRRHPRIRLLEQQSCLQALHV